MAEVLCVEEILKTGKIQSSITCSIEKKLILALRSSSVSLRMNAQRKNMQKHCGGCLWDEREI